MNDAQMIGLLVAGGIGRHVGNHPVGGPAQLFLQLVRRVGVEKILGEKFDARDRLDVENIDTDHCAPPLRRAGPFRRDLRPAARRRAEIGDLLARPQKAIFVVDFQELEGGARTKTLSLGPRHIGIVELPIEPQGRREASLARRFHARFQAAAALAARRAGRFFHQPKDLSARISSSSMPSRRPRSAMRMRSEGKARRMPSNMAQPASTRSARSGPMQPLRERSA